MQGITPQDSRPSVLPSVKRVNCSSIVVVVVVVVVVYLHEKNQFSKMLEYNGKLYNIIYRIQFQTYTMQTRSSHKSQNL